MPLLYVRISSQRLFYEIPDSLSRAAADAIMVMMIVNGEVGNVGLRLNQRLFLFHGEFLLLKTLRTSVLFIREVGIVMFTWFGRRSATLSQTLTYMHITGSFRCPWRSPRVLAEANHRPVDLVS